MRKINILLFIFLALGFFLSFMPHLNYNYPLHVDEWIHFTYSQHISDGTPLYFGGESNSLEHGFHILLAVLSLIAVPYLIMFKFFAGFLTVLICLAVFILTRKYFDEDSALFSVLFVVLLKSSVQILGPMFLVPMVIGLFLIPISLFIADSSILFLIVAGTLIIHPPSGIALLILLGCYSLIYKEIKPILMHSFIGIALSLPLFISQFMQRGINNLEYGTSLINVLFIPHYMGYLITGFVILGIFAALYKKKYLFFAYTVVLLILAVLYYNFGINILIMYERNLMYLFLSFSILFGVGCTFLFSRFKKYKLVLYILLAILLIAVYLPEKIQSTEEVYHIVNDSEYQDFINIPNQQGAALVHPWKANAFTPLAKMQVYTRVIQSRNENFTKMNDAVFDYFYNNCTNKTFLNGKDITLVYGCPFNN